jgi:polyhydroxyalkanoate synthesis regulator phasin
MRTIFDVGDDEEQSKGRGRQLEDRRDDHAVNDDIDKLRRQLDDLRARLDQSETLN